MQSLLQYRRARSSAKKQLELGYELNVFQQPLYPRIPPLLPANFDLLFPAPVYDPSPTSASTSSTTLTTKHRSYESLSTAIDEAEAVPTAAAQGIFAPNEVSQTSTAAEEQPAALLVDWDGNNDPLNPRNWSIIYRLWVTSSVTAICFVMASAAAALIAVLPQAAAELGVSDLVEELAISFFLIGYAVGSLFVGPFSETYGRNAVYIPTMIFFIICITATSQSVYVETQIVFRFLAGTMSAAPLTCSGGSLSDMWPALQKTYAIPFFLILGFGGSLVGPVAASYVLELGSWRWADYIILIMAGSVLLVVVSFQPETYAPTLLTWKAKHLRDLTGDKRYKSELEIQSSSISLEHKLRIALTRPVRLAMEPIVYCLSFYVSMLFVVMFTIFDGYSEIFSDTYGISQELTNVMIVGIFTGLVLGFILLPCVYKITRRSFEVGTFKPEIRLWFAMFGAPAIPISLFWMAWTDFASVSIWSPILASVLLGYGFITVYLSAYMYIVDSYEMFAASALTFMAVSRYLLSAGLTVAGVPFYENMGPHWTLTILAFINLALTPMPYIFYKYGHLIRRRSKTAVKWDRD